MAFSEVERTASWDARELQGIDLSLALAVNQTSSRVRRAFTQELFTAAAQEAEGCHWVTQEQGTGHGRKCMAQNYENNLEKAA